MHQAKSKMETLRYSPPVAAATQSAVVLFLPAPLGCLPMGTQPGPDEILLALINSIRFA